MTNVFLLPVLLDQVHRLGFGDSGLWILNGVAAFLGALAGGFGFDRELYPAMSLRSWFHHALAGWGLRLGLWAGLIAAVVCMPPDFGWGMIGVIVAYLAVHFAVQWGLVFRYLRWVNFMYPAGDRLRRIVNETSARTAVNVRATWELEGVQALAFASTTTGELILSRRLLEICSDEEIAAISAHEMAHLAESKWVLAGRLLGSLAFFPLIFVSPLIHWLGVMGICIPFLAMLAISRFALWFSQRMEKRADSAAVASQAGDGVYAVALEKIYRENLLPAVNPDERQSHPHLYDRMVAAGITPDYPRPEKPRKTTRVGTVIWCALGIVIALQIMRLSPAVE